MLSFRLGTGSDFNWGCISYYKPHAFSTFIGDEKEKNVHLFSLTCVLVVLLVWSKTIFVIQWYDLFAMLCFYTY